MVTGDWAYNNSTVFGYVTIPRVLQYVYVCVYICIYVYVNIYIYILQILPVKVAVILQYYIESTATYCEPTVKFLNLQLFCTKYYMNFGEFTSTIYSVYIHIYNYLI